MAKRTAVRTNVLLFAEGLARRQKRQEAERARALENLRVTQVAAMQIASKAEEEMEKLELAK